MADRDDPEDLSYWAEIMNKSHGYGGVFNHKTAKDKEIVEVSTAYQWKESIAAEFGIIVGNPRINTDDPPDCYVQFEGHEVGVELVQLVDREHKARASKEESPYYGRLWLDMQWSLERFSAALKDIILRKGATYKKRGKRLGDPLRGAG